MRRAPAVLVGVLAASCYAFPAADLGQCHNSIIEANEDCDDADPDHCLECRLVCTPYVSDTRCPEGRVCGSDGLCRAPSGDFATEALRIERAGVHWLAAGDLDGDRRDDVVMQTSDPAIEVIHLADRPITVRLALALGRAGVGDLDDDARADVVVGHVPGDDVTVTARGLSLLGERRLGDDDRAPVARVLASLVTEGGDARLLAPAPVRDRVLEVVGPTTTRWWSSGAHAATEVSPALPVDPGTLARAVAIDDLDGTGEVCSGAPDGPDFPRPELALASIGDDRIRIVSSCGGGASFVLDELPPLALPPGATLGEAGTFFADVDADGRVDLLTQTSAGAVLVGYGVGDGTFHGSTPAPVEGGDGVLAAAPLWVAADADELLLVVAELDGHPQVELVTNASFVHAPEACDALCIEPWPGTLSAALAIDLDDDGALDVATVAGDVLAVALTELTDDRVVLTRQERMLAGPADALTLGDFDHDTVDDLAMIERGPDGRGTSVGVLYGGAPNDWRHESFGPFVDAHALVVDDRDTLVVRTNDDHERPAGAFVRPGYPAADFGFTVHQPAFVRANEAMVVASIATHEGDAEDRLVHFGFAGGTLSPHDIVDGAVLTGMLAGSGAQALLAPIELGGPGELDELVVLGTTAEGGTIWVAQLEPSGAWVVIDRFLVGPGFARRSPGTAEGPGSSLVVVDVDRDDAGLADVVVTTDEVLPRALVLRNADGRLSAHPPIALFDAVHFDAFELAQLQPWHDADDGAPRLLVGGDDGVGVATIDLEAARLLIDDVTSAHARALASADVDADGLLDLVIATSQDVRIHLAQERVGGD